MNIVMLIGNVANDVEVHITQDGSKRANFTLAVVRHHKNAQGHEADFIHCVAWNKLADFAEKYVTIGKKLAVTGMLQSRSYVTQDDQKRYVHEVVLDEIEFVLPPDKQAKNKPDRITLNSKDDCPD